MSDDSASHGWGESTVSEGNELHGTSDEGDALARAVFIATMVGCIAFIVGVFVIIL